MSANQEHPQSTLILATMQGAGQVSEILQGLQDSGLRAVALVERKTSGELSFSSPNVTLDSETLLLSEALQEQVSVHIPSENLPAGQAGLLLLVDDLQAINLAEMLAGEEDFSGYGD